ncbi:MAG: 2'-5' RNA ligase family protein [Leptolyngbyaceae cyanobacterium SM1_3_5]|nr:2'-5' RNA ligase family protein [Leptolyngbyaceae cyanobacterium SM1_3_5]
MTPPPLILTLKLDRITFNRLNDLRQRHFPPARNFLPAHITLFHALPGDRAESIESHLETVCAETEWMKLKFPTVRSLGRGVAAEIDAPDLLRLRQRLAIDWQSWLTRQDQQKYRPHVTIQNKVSPEEAKQLYQELAASWEPIEAIGEGLLLWRYLSGPWELAREFSFAKSDSF